MPESESENRDLTPASTMLLDSRSLAPLFLMQHHHRPLAVPILGQNLRGEQSSGSRWELPSNPGLVSYIQTRLLYSKPVEDISTHHHEKKHMARGKLKILNF